MQPKSKFRTKNRIFIANRSIFDENFNTLSIAAVAADDDRCSRIGSDIMTNGGSGVDGMIATLLCDGVVNPYHSGIGGETFFTIFDPKTPQKATFIDCRGTAPGKATEDMFGTDSVRVSTVE